MPPSGPATEKHVHFNDQYTPQLQSTPRQWVDNSPIVYNPDGQPLRTNVPWSSTPNSFVRPARPYEKKFVKWTLKLDLKKCSLSRYLQHFETHATLHHYTEEDTCNQLLDGLGHDGAYIIDRLGPSYSYSSLRDTLFNYYEPEESRGARSLQFQNAKREPKQSPRDFANKLDDLARLSFGSISKNERDKMVIRQFIVGHAPSLVPMLLACRFSTLDEAVNHVEMLENMPDVLKPSKPHDASRPTFVRHDVAQAAYAQPSQPATSCDAHIAEVDGIMDVLLTTSSPEDYTDEDVFCEVLASQVYRRFPQAASQGEKCFYCGLKGHRWLKCYRLRSKLQQNGLRTPVRQQGNPQGRQPSPTGRGNSPYPRDSQYTRDTPASGRGRGKSRGRGRGFQNLRRALVNMLDTCMEDDDSENAENEEEEQSEGQQTKN